MAQRYFFSSEVIETYSLLGWCSTRTHQQQMPFNTYTLALQVYLIYVYGSFTLVSSFYFSSSSFNSVLFFIIHIEDVETNHFV